MNFLALYLMNWYLQHSREKKKFHFDICVFALFFLIKTKNLWSEHGLMLEILSNNYCKYLSKDRIKFEIVYREKKEEKTDTENATKS